MTAGGGHEAILALSVLTFLLGSAEVLRDNAAQTILPSVVDKADLEHANGQMWSAEQVMGQFVGPPLAGALIGLGIVIPFGFDAATFAIAATLVWLIVLPPQATRPQARFWKAMAEGVAWMRANRVILRLAVMLGCVNALHIATLTVMVLFAQDILGLDAFGYGLLLTVEAVGAVIGGLLAPALTARIGLRASMIGGMVTFALSYLTFALTASVTAAALALAVSAAGSMLWNVATVSYRQRIIPNEVLGRVNSIYRFFGWGSMPLGALAGGAMVSLLEGPLGRDLALRAPFVAAAAGTVLLLVYAVRRLQLD
jgi:MFS family permease